MSFEGLSSQTLMVTRSGILVMAAVVGVLISFVFYILLVVIKKSSKTSKFQSLPTLPVGPWTFLRASAEGKIPSSFLQWHREHQDTVGQIYKVWSPVALFSLFSSPLALALNKDKLKFVVITDPRVARKFLTDSLTVKPEKIYARFKPLHDRRIDTMLIANGHRWFHARKAMNVAFSSSHIKRMRNVTVTKVEEFMKKLDKLEQQNKDGEGGGAGCFDVGKEMVGLTLKVICDAAFQYQMSDEEQEEFVKDLVLAMKEQQKASIPLRWRLGKFIPTVREARTASRALQDMAAKMLNHYRMMENPIPNTVIDCIAKNQSYDNDHERMADMVLLLIAGHDTTAYSIAFTLLELAKHPEEQAKLRNDLGSSSLEEQLQSSTLSHVIKEGMRLNSVAPMGGARISSKDFVDKETNIVIPKHTMVTLPSVLMLRDERYFPNPDSFQPSRWENASKDAADAFMPFLVGKRNCVGQSLANAEMKTVLSMLCSQYEISVEEEGSRTHFVTYKPVKCLLKARKLLI
mmetsp:Transcript_9212/g.10686  ORF Transcript_9212/g.10686 Transcript_9212/m.10686 type:complete len:517 (+) Transcript_9212:2-1552(+)